MLNNQFQFPEIGSKGNWGTAINSNFRIVDRELRKIYSNINALQSLLGSNMPYVKLDDYKYFVSFVDDDVSKTIVIKYFNKTHAAGDGEGTATYTYDYDSNVWTPSAPPAGTAAYVIQGLNSSGLPGGQTFERGDFAVVVEEFGSIYGNNFVSRIYKKYPTLGEYYIPQENQQAPYKLIFTKTNYVDWFQISEPIKFLLPNIGLSTFNYFTYKNRTYTINGENTSVVDNTISFTFEMSDAESAGDNYTFTLNWFINDAPLFVSHYVTRSVENGALTMSIHWDPSGILENETVRCEVSVAHKNDMIRTGNL